MFLITKCRIVVALVGVTALSVAVHQTQAAPQQQQTTQQDRYVVIDGWAVHGYANGKEIGYAWYKTRAEAEQAKAQMEKIEVTNGKYYDKVEIRSERRRYRIDQVPNRARDEQADPSKSGGRPGTEGGRITFDEDAPESQPGSARADAAKNNSPSEQNPSGSGAKSNGSGPSGSEISLRDKAAGRRYEAPDAEYEVTLHDGRKFTFQNHAEALKYMHKINENPAWRATLREVPKRNANAANELKVKANAALASTTWTGYIDLTQKTMTISFNADGTLVYKTTGDESLNGTWTLSGNSFAAKLPDKQGYVGHLTGVLQDNTIRYRYRVYHPDRGYSGWSRDQTFSRTR